MLYQERKWKEISHQEYSKLLKKFNRGKSDFEKMFYISPVRKELKQSIKDDLVPTGCGILEYIRLESEIKQDTFSPDSYIYYKDDGVEWVFMGGEESCKEFKRLYNL